MREVLNFTSNSFDLRYIVFNEKTWIIAEDICKCLGTGNVSSTVSAAEKKDSMLFPIETDGGVQELLLVDAMGLLSIAFVSRKKVARSFCEWIVGHVVPKMIGK